MNWPVVVLVLGLLCVSELKAKQCQQQDRCSCRFDDGTIMDISSLGNHYGTPRFEDVLAEAEGLFYSYNPCAGFEELSCEDATVCRYDRNKNTTYQIGDFGTARYKYDGDSGNVVVTYTSTNTYNQTSTTDVVLICDAKARKPSIVAYGKYEPNHYVSVREIVSNGSIHETS